jgi:outer membrane protein
MIKYLLTNLTLLVLSLTAVAQESLSLAEAISTGLERNYGIQIERANVEIATGNNTWGQAGALPTITLNAQSQNSIRNQESDNQFFGGQLFPGFELDDQRTYVVTPSAQVSWTIFQGGKALISKRRLDQLEAESMQNADIVVSNTIQSIILGYYLVVLEKQRLNVYEKQFTLSKDRYEYVKTRLDIGGAVTSDLLLEEDNYLTDSANLINQRLAYNNVLRNLNILLVEEELEKEYAFSDSLYFEKMEFEYADLEQSLYADNVDLKKLFTSQSILRSQTVIARSDIFPTLSMNGGYQWSRDKSDLTNAEYTGPNQNYQNPPDPLISKTGTYYANFTLSFNLYNGGKINRAIRNSVIQEDIGNMRIDDLKISLRKDLMEAYDRYMIRSQLYGISEKRVASAKTNLDISGEKFRNGSINSFDYRVVQNNYLSASIQELQALYNLIDSKVELMRLTGGIIETYNQ